MVILPYIDYQGIKLVANQLVKAVRQAGIVHEKGISGYVSISAGYAVWKATDVVDEDSASLIEDADISLFEAKERGRNQAKG